MSLESLRETIDRIDLDMQKLFKERMAISKQIGLYKREHHLPVFDRTREEQLIQQRKIAFNDESLWPYYEAFLKEMIRLSKEIQ